ncbi:Amidohydrolase [Pigmentiphaga humi]|uniref:Amidohydrolase n=1 Tax=Pigmentiphaga humi TaxID=2478468 RepID=A0A3P4B8N0_9BURK|nr:amidohydrolase family protein [Pigmentiphaga humi]VCU71876.1 Amidohydrolase [Pigmentiphaga humi]
MFKNKAVIDMHGHMSTPPHFRALAYNLTALRTPSGTRVKMPEAAQQAALERHLRLLDERQVDMQLISPRPVAMMHWERPHLVENWTQITNNVIADQCALHSTRFAGIAQLPQTRELNIGACVEELHRSVEELGFVGALLNPDPGGDRCAPGMDDPAWFPLYAAAEKLDATLVVHPSVSFDRRIEKLPHSYQYNNLTEETLATALLERGEVFGRYPRLRVVVCHCGGAPRRLLAAGDTLDASQPPGPSNTIAASGEKAGGQVGMPGSEETDTLPDTSANLFFDTCAYDPFYLEAAVRQRGPARMVFGTETPGSGSALLNPRTGRPADDILATLDSFDFLSEAQKIQIVHDNPLRIFPLLQGKEGTWQR